MPKPIAALHNVIRLSLILVSLANAQAPKEVGVPIHATGTFDVKVTPLANDTTEGAPLGRFSVDKRYHGDLDAAGKGEMLTAGNAASGSAGYVAIERVTGTLAGRRGTFALQHSGSMNRGTMQLTITVVPASGTDQLAGLTGTLTITITEGKHFYDFAYTLADR